MLLPKMDGKLLKYEGRVNRMTYQVKWNWSWHGRYSGDTEGWVPPATGSSYNTTTTFIARVPFTVTVDYGDGTVEQHNSVAYGSSSYGAYRVAFRHFLTEVEDNADQLFSYETIPPHHYADDDKDTVRTVVLEFSEDITYVNWNYAWCEGIPVLELPELSYLALVTDENVKDIPVDVFMHIPNLEHLLLSYMQSSSDVIPESIWTMENLTELQLYNVFPNCTDIDSSGIRNIVRLQKLTVFKSYGQVWGGTYLKEFVEMPNLSQLEIIPTANTHNKTGVAYNDMPVMEVDSISPTLRYYDYINDYLTSYSRTAWPYHLSGYGWENILRINMYCARNVVLDPLPEYWYEHRAATQFVAREMFGPDGEERAVEFITLFYKFVTEWEYATMSSVAGDGKRNQWYGMTVSYRDLTSNYINVQPPGLYLPTEGFVQGSSNGNPTTAMEMIYVLEKNYNQTWNTIDRPTS